MKIVYASLLAGWSYVAQVTNPTQTNNNHKQSRSNRSRFIGSPSFPGRRKAVNYRHRGGATKINFAGTALMPKARGEAKVESKKGYIEIEVEFDDMNVGAEVWS